MKKKKLLKKGSKLASAAHIFKSMNDNRFAKDSFDMLFLLLTLVKN